MIFSSSLALALVAAVGSAHILPAEKSICSTDHISLHSHNASILNSTYYAVGALNVSGTFNVVPFCEIYGSVSYGQNDSLIFATWLPDKKHYRDRFLAVGNGGMAGVIDYAGMLTQLNSGLGLSVAGGNAGHLASQNNEGGGAPGVYLPYLHDKAQVDAWIHDAISLFTPAAKALTSSFYGQRPAHSYYAGCSTGGAQGFALAQFRPDLFDAIYAGSPGNWYSHLALSFLWNAQHTNTTASYLTQAELNLTTNAVIKACDGIDGVEDSLIENPLRCTFDITSLACNGTRSNDTTCLSPEKLRTARAIYAGPIRSDDGSQIYPGFDFGSESGWALEEGPLADAFSTPILQNLVFKDLEYNSSVFNWASDVEAVDRNAGRFIDEKSPDLSAFRKHGGKMLTTQGWADPLNAAKWPIEHLSQLENFFGGNVSDFYRLFMVPGGGHCGATSYYPSVPATYHVVPALIEWVERGREPNHILSSDAPDGSNRTRKLCSWPATARYLSGDVDNWHNYACH